MEVFKAKGSQTVAPSGSGEACKEALCSALEVSSYLKIKNTFTVTDMDLGLR